VIKIENTSLSLWQLVGTNLL